MAETRQQRLSAMCEQLSAQIALIVRLSGGDFDESKGADLIYKQLRDFIHSEDDRERNP